LHLQVDFLVEFLLEYGEKNQEHQKKRNMLKMLHHGRNNIMLLFKGI